MLNRASQNALTDRVIDLTGRKWCVACTRFMPLDDGVIKIDAKGKKQWRCANCVARGKAILASKGK